MNPPEQTTVVIPAAGQVAESLVPLSGRLSTAMIPLNGKPVIYWTIDYLRSQGFRRFVLAVGSEDGAIVEFVRRVFDGQIEVTFVVPDRDVSLGYTVDCCRPHVDTDSALVVLGDTFFRFDEAFDWEATDSFVLTHRVVEPWRWCLVETDSAGQVTRLVDKPEEYEGPMHALIGVYGLSDFPAFAACLSDVRKDNGEGGVSLDFNEALQRYAKQGLQAVACGEWYDCGSPDNLMQSRKRLLPAREFNRIYVDELMGTVTKRSDMSEKFADEISYYQLLPRDLQVLFPRILDSDAHGAEPFVTMEYYGYPTLSELFVFENLDHRVWRGVFEHLLAVVQRCTSYSKPADRASFDYMYRLRVDDRVARLRRSGPELAALVEGYPELIVNGQRVRNFSEIWPAVATLMDRLILAEKAHIVHGDLCFSNILYDINSRLVKLIDPRGSFGAKGVYGDSRYDIAKLYHSVHGLYDFLINDLFHFQREGREIEFRVFVPDEVQRIRKAFDEVFFGEFDRQEILLIEGLLFVTMGALHYDHPRRQMAMYITGLSIWNSLPALAEDTADVEQAQWLPRSA